MKFKNRSVTQQIAYMAIMAAINVILVLIGTLLPLSTLIFVFALPLTSVIVTLNCDLKYYPIYAITSLILGFVISFSSIDIALFYLFPSLITGFIMGISVKLKIDPIHLIVLVSLINLGLFYAAIPLFNLIYEINYLYELANLIGLKNHRFGLCVLPSLVFVVSLIQATLSYILILFELRKFLDYKDKNNVFVFIIISSVLILTSCLFGPISAEIAYLFLFIAFPYITYLLIRFYRFNLIAFYIMLGTLIIFTILGFVVSQQLLPISLSLLSLLLPLTIVVFEMSLWLYIKYRKQQKSRNIDG